MTISEGKQINTNMRPESVQRWRIRPQKKRGWVKPQAEIGSARNWIEGEICIHLDLRPKAKDGGFAKQMMLKGWNWRAGERVPLSFSIISTQSTGLEWRDCETRGKTTVAKDRLILTIIAYSYNSSRRYYWRGLLVVNPLPIGLSERNDEEYGTPRCVHRSKIQRQATSSISWKNAAICSRRGNTRHLQMPSLILLYCILFKSG